MKKYLLEREKDPILFGVELEVECPIRSQTGEGDLNGATETKVRTIAQAARIELAFGRDGGGIETAFSPASFKWLKQNKSFLEQVLNIYRDAGYKETGSQSAGIHIHIDRKAFTKENFVDFISWLRENKDFLLEFSQRGRRTSYTNVETHEGKSRYQFTTENVKEWTGFFTTEDWCEGFGTNHYLECPECGEGYNIANSMLEEGSDCPACLAHNPQNHVALIVEEVSAQYVDYVGNNCLTLNRNGNGTIECRFFNSTLEIDRFMANIDFIHALTFFIKSDRDKTLKGFLKYCAQYAWKYDSFVKFYLIPKGLLSEEVIKTIKPSKKKKKRHTNVHFN